MDASVDQYFDQIKAEKDFFTKAKMLQHLKKEKNIRIIDLSKKIGIKPSFICHILRLNRIPEIVIDGYYAKQISISHLFIVSRLKDKKQIAALYEKILSENLTVARTEETVREIIHKIKTTGQYLTNEEILRCIDSLKAKYKNISAKIIQTRIKSKFVIEIKGSLQEGTAVLKQILKKLTE